MSGGNVLPCFLVYGAKVSGKTHGIEYVILEPLPQRDVPASPELTDGTGKERLPEIFRHIYSQHLGRPAYYIHTPGKFRVYLQCIEYGGDGQRAAAVVTVVGKYGAHDEPGSVGYHQFFEYQMCIRDRKHTLPSADVYLEALENTAE